MPDTNKIEPTNSANDIIDMAIQIVSRRVHQSDDIISDPRALKQYLILNFAELGHEIFGAIFLDSANRVLGMETLFRGTLNHTSVYPREVIKTALSYNAAGVILYHNHPTGSIKPSPADIHLTERLGNALKLVDMTVLDHIIVAGINTVSFSELHLMPVFKNPN